MTIPRERIEQLNDPYWTPSLQKEHIPETGGALIVTPSSIHLRNKTVWNLVLLRPDDLPGDTMTATADVAEMKKCFEGWDPKLKCY
jgi:hypothetical protein